MGSTDRKKKNWIMFYWVAASILYLYLYLLDPWRRKKNWIMFYGVAASILRPDRFFTVDH